jgi:hypothetical protein
VRTIIFIPLFFLIKKLLSLFHDVSIRGSHCLCRIDRQVFSFMGPAPKRGIYPNQQTELPYILLTPYKLSPGRIETRSRRTTRRETGGREGSIRGETSGRESPREARRRGCKDIRIRSSMHEMPGSEHTSSSSGEPRRWRETARETGRRRGTTHTSSGALLRKEKKS